MYSVLPSFLQSNKVFCDLLEVTRFKTIRSNMKLLTILTIVELILVGGVDATPAAPPQPGLKIDESNRKQLDELVHQLEILNAQNSKLENDFTEDYNLILRDLDYEDLSARSDLPILDTVFRLVNSSGVAILATDFLLTREPLLDTAIDTLIRAIDEQWVNITTIFIALDQSGLLLDTLMHSIKDPDVLPGLLRITKEVINQSGFRIFNVRETKDLADQSPEDSTSIDVFKRENSLLVLLFTSLKDSGLVVSLTNHILTTPELAPGAAHFVWRTLKLRPLTLYKIFDALKRSNLIWNLLREIINVPAILSNFSTIITQTISLKLNLQ